MNVKMWIVILILSVTPCHAIPEFSSRPTNVSLVLIDFIHKELNQPTFLGSFGIWSLIASLSFGAHGDTYNQIFRSFLLPTDTDKFNIQYKNLTDAIFKRHMKGVRILNRNYLIGNFKDPILLSDFKHMFLDYYNTKSVSFEFQDINAASYINEEINFEFTSVTNIFHPRDFKDTALVMTNVLSFEGNWSLPFNASSTRKELVRTSQGESGEVNMMYLRGKVPSSHVVTLQASVTELPFGNDGKFCMLLLFPDPNVSTDEVFRNIEKLTFRDIFDKLQRDQEESGLKEIEVKLPTFVKTSSIQLKKPLNDMGIYDAFDPTVADFSKMSGEPIYIETIEHKAAIIVKEFGTVAYASTPGFFTENSELEETKTLPPLILFIIEKPTVTVLFGGIF